MNNKLLFGVGINDAVYRVTRSEWSGDYYTNGKKKMTKVWHCPYHNIWRTLLMRCYDKTYLSKRPTYKGCTVQEGWKRFSVFKSWLISQDWQHKQLDKDILKEGNKHYCEEYCAFVDNKVNTFIISCAKVRGTYLIGCCWDKGRGKFKAACRNPLSPARGNLGRYDTELEAHFAWKKQKHLYSCELANSIYVTDDRVKEVLLHRYENYTVVEDHLK
mgnify:CR=1 FL=1|tara:strand:+ start:250 stop:897 length:648 start_codon:yes stop_codon:yes gene_type:complete